MKNRIEKYGDKWFGKSTAYYAVPRSKGTWVLNLGFTIRRPKFLKSKSKFSNTAESKFSSFYFKKKRLSSFQKKKSFSRFRRRLFFFKVKKESPSWAASELILVPLFTLIINPRRSLKKKSEPPNSYPPTTLFYPQRLFLEIQKLLSVVIVTRGASLRHNQHEPT